MGPPTISADQRKDRMTVDTHHSGFNGAADDLGGSTSINSGRLTFSPLCFNGAADDLGGSTAYGTDTTWPSSCFNGAADDLGGSTSEETWVCAKTLMLQWGRRRSRRINTSPLALVAPSPVPSMGPPTISADQRVVVDGGAPEIYLQWGRRRSRRINRGEPGKRRPGRHPSMGPPTISADQHIAAGVGGPITGPFNGAADDLGGSTKSAKQAPYRSHSFNGAADDLGGSTSRLLRTTSSTRNLQWGRRRSRRINVELDALVPRIHTFNGAADDLGGSTAAKAS